VVPTSFKAVATVTNETTSITRVPLLMASVSKGPSELNILATTDPEVTCTPHDGDMGFTAS
jgi:hypothetical protein